MKEWDKTNDLSKEEVLFKIRIGRGKDCGTVMRAAPFGLAFHHEPDLKWDEKYRREISQYEKKGAFYGNNQRSV